MTSNESNPIFIKADAHGNVYLYHATKDEEISIPEAAFHMLVKHAPEITAAAEGRKKGKWMLNKEWFVHINLYTFPTKKYMFKKVDTSDEPKKECLIHLRRWFSMNNERMPSKEGFTFTVNGWLQLKQEVLFFASEVMGRVNSNGN